MLFIALLVIFFPIEAVSSHDNVDCTSKCSHRVIMLFEHNSDVSESECMTHCLLKQQNNFLQTIIKNQEISHHKLDAIKSSTDSCT